MPEADAKKVKLTITPCDENNGQVSLAKDPQPFEAMLNPSTWKHSLAIYYNSEAPQGKAAKQLKFRSMGDDTVTFSLMLDGTGVVEPIAKGKPVATRIDELKKVAYQYNSKGHEPRIVRVLWGKLIHFGRLQSMSIDYNLFKPSGEPLRAKVDLSFKGTMSVEEEAVVANRQSPDLTHQIVFKAGDSLPNLCQRFYGDDGYYTAVARYNRIVNFRAIPPGTTLFFPPLK